MIIIQLKARYFGEINLIRVNSALNVNEKHKYFEIF